MKISKTFTDAVLDAVREIPKGETLTYKEVATRAGNPFAARAVGMIMSRNTDTTVHCHRVIRSDGKIGGYNSINGPSKRQLLIDEGVSL